ncbi:MAG TPA: alpha-L-fucosidase [bacterium]|nr:alpha-L-fucosidase [bacterium]
MGRRILAAVAALILISGVAFGAADYEADWASLDARPVPGWFTDAKFGIFIHWGLYSVPAWSQKGKYSEWYWYWMNLPGSPEALFHAKVYGENFAYQDFAPMFRAELFDPAEWAGILEGSGAKYVVLTSKHHDGFCLWPSEYSWNWNSGDAGPHRDLAGDLSRSVKSRGLKMGFYYSLYEWYNPMYVQPAKDAVSTMMQYTKKGKKKKKRDPEAQMKEYVEKHMLPQLRELVTAYKPSMIWTDGEWDYPSGVWQSEKFLAWLFSKSPVADEIVVNDRWGSGTRGVHGGFHTTEYGDLDEFEKKRKAGHPWEECRGIGASFGYNRNESLNEYKSAAELIHMLVDIVSFGGNLLLDIGPTADGRIPVIMQQRLSEIGNWLAVNGEAIYGTRPWRTATDGEYVRYTSRDGAVYAISMKWPGPKLELAEPKPGGDVVVTIPGVEQPLTSRFENGRLIIDVPALTIDRLPAQHAFVFKITGIK